MHTLAQQVTDTLRYSILHGQFKPGERIEELPLCERMKASRTPVRAALAALVNEGLIDYQPKRGYTVRAFQLDSVLSAYEVRAVIEGLACRKAAERGLSDSELSSLRQCLADGDRMLSKGTLMPEDHEPYQKMNVDLHTILIGASANPWVSRFAQQAQNIPYASDRVVLWDVGHGVILRSHGDHHCIVDAVANRDGARAEQLMREHVYVAGIIMKGNFERLVRAEQASGPTS